MDIGVIEKLRGPQRSRDRLLQGAECVVTGQQVGFATGPAYTVLKAITALRVARARDLVPLFWVASEDHDVDEVSGTFRISEGGDLMRHRVALPKGKFVEDLPLLPEHRQELERYFELVGLEMPQVRSQRYAGAMVELLMWLFRETELLFVEPFELREFAQDYFAQEELEHLFVKLPDGSRVRATERSGTLSPDVYGRPVMQSWLIPTQVYVAGPNELLYYRELGPHHARLGVAMPELMERLHLTFDRAGATAHYRENLLHPRGKPQERMLNWFFFEGLSDEPLIPQLLEGGWREQITLR